jgi:hypothetical protein
MSDQCLRADDEARTRDLNLGKVALYQLSYVRLSAGEHPPVTRVNFIGQPVDDKSPGRALASALI